MNEYVLSPLKGKHNDTLIDYNYDFDFLITNETTIKSYF